MAESQREQLQMEIQLHQSNTKMELDQMKHLLANKEREL